MKSARWTVISVRPARQSAARRAMRGRAGTARERQEEEEESRRNPVERSGVHTGVCRVPDPRPSPYKLHRGPLDGALLPPLRRKIRPPGASRRRATDNHVTLLPYRYQSRRHNNRAARVPPPLCAHRWKGKKKGNRRKESSSILGIEPVQYLPSSVHSRTRFRGGEDRCPRFEGQ